MSKVNLKFGIFWYNTTKSIIQIAGGKQSGEESDSNILKEEQEGWSWKQTSVLNYDYNIKYWTDTDRLVGSNSTFYPPPVDK